MELSNTRIFRIIVLFLLLPVTSCGKTNPSIPNENIIAPAGMFVFSPTETRTITPTLSVTATQTPTTTLSPYPTISYPLKPGPVITRENARRIVLLGTVPEKLAGGVAGAQLAWSPDSSRIAVTTEGEGVRIIDPLQMKEIGEILQNTEGIFDRPGGVAYTPNGKVLAVSIPQGIYSNPGDIVYYDAITFQKTAQLPYPFGAYVLTFSHNGKWMAFGSHTVAWVINLEPYDGLFKIGESRSEYTFVLFSEDDRFFAVSGVNLASPLLVSTATWSLEYELDGEICFSPDNSHFAMTPGIWELESYQEVMTFGEDFFIGVCSFGKQGDILINSQSGTGLDIWDVATGELLTSWGEKTKFGWYSFSLSPDGRFIAMANTSENALTIWGILGE